MPINAPSEKLPQEFNAGYFENLDNIFQQNEKRQFDRTRMGLESSGMMPNRDEFTPAANQVLPSSQDRRSSMLLPELQNASGMGRGERLASLEFEHQRQFADEEFQRRLQEIAAQAAVRRQLIELKDSLSNQGGFDWGGTLGQVAGTAAGAYFGGPVGAAAGGSIGKSLGSQAGK